MQSMGEFLRHYRMQRQATRKLVAAIPEAYFAWTPSPTAFSCGDLVRHMMQAESFWRRLIVAGARGEGYDPFALTGTSTDRLTAFRASNLQTSKSEKFGATASECLQRWSEIQEKTERELGALPPEAFTASVAHPLATLSGPVWEACLGMIEHEIHHRGQLSAYLKMIGVEQPASLFD
jgi:uncharacterized damage-inducible protein DinB